MVKLPDFPTFADEMKALCERKQTITLKLTALDAWAILSQIQLASRHPENTGPTRNIAERIARQLQEQIATTPALAQTAEAGWDPEYDQ